MGVATSTPDLEPVSLRPGLFRTGLFPYALIAPSVAVIAGILAFPLGMLVWLSLQHYGLRELALTLIFSTLIALLLLKVRQVVRVLVMSALVFVWATPVIVTVDIWQWMFDYEFGVINYLLTQLHLGNFIHHNWFDNPVQGLAVLVVVVVWGAIPFVTITLFAGLLQVPGDVLEAAEVDGASPWHTFWFVTAPMLKPIFLIVTCLSTIWDFSARRSRC